MVVVVVAFPPSAFILELLVSVVFPPFLSSTLNFSVLLISNFLLVVGNGIFFTPTDKCVELYITKQNDLPIAIYGYTSTALFTLRIMLPNIPIFNVFFSGNNKDGVKNYNSISDTYNSKGIPTIRM